MKKDILNFLVLIGTIFLFLIFFELSLRIIDYKDPSKLNEFKLGYKFIISDNEKVIYELKPNCSAFQCGQPTNSLGMRDREYSFKKPKNVLRIILIGDSVLYGPHIEKKNLFSEILEEKLNNAMRYDIEVMNYGVPGYDIYQEFEIFKESLNLNPDIIILHGYTNDAAKKFLVKSNDGFVAYEHFDDYDYVIESKYNKFLLKNIFFYRFINYKLSKIFHVNKSYFYAIEGYQDKVDEMNEMAYINNVSFYVVFHPYLINYSDRNNINNINTQNQYKEVFSSLNITTLDLGHYYEKYDFKNLRVLEDDEAHLSEFGHKITADTMYTFLLPKLKP